MNKSVPSLAAGLALLVTAILLTAAGPRPGQSLVPSQAVAPRLYPPLGVNVSLEAVTPAAREAALQAIASRGFGWIRQRFPWDKIEPQPGQFDWRAWDELVAGAHEQGLALVAVLDGSPAWARRAGDAENPLAPPQQRADFGRFAAAFAGRYAEQLRFYQVWDEPNIAPHWGNRAADAADYAGLLHEAAVHIRSADPDAVILSAALAPNVEPGGANQSDIAFLDHLYAAGAAPWFDAVAGQAYGFADPPNAPPLADRLNFRRPELLRQVMAAHGDAGTALWLTAYGWHSAANAQAAAASPWGSVAPDEQAHWAAEALEWARLNWPWSGALAWTIWQPAAPAGDPSWGFALLDGQGRASPTLAGLTAWAAEPKPLGPGAWPPDAAALRYQGAWRVTKQAADPPNTASEQATQPGQGRLLIPFQGTGLALQVQRGPYWGYFDVAVDGLPANGLPIDDAGRATLLLYDPLAAAATVTVADGLTDGPHLAEIVAHGGWEQWPLQGLLVWRGSTPAWPGWLRWLLGGLGLLLLAALPAVRSRAYGLAIHATGLLDETVLHLAGPPSPAAYGILGALALAVALLPGFLKLVALGLAFLLLVLRPAAALPLVGLLTPLHLLALPLLGRRFNPLELAIWLAVAALVTRTLLLALARRLGSRLNPAPHLGRPAPLDWAMVALLAAAALSTLAAANFGVASHELRTVMLAGAMAYGLVRLTPRRNRLSPWPLVWGIALGALAVAGWGLYQAVSGTGLITAEGVARVRGPYGSPNNLALYLGHMVPILLAIAALAQDSRRRLAAALLSLPIALALVLTFSKGALLLGLPAAVLFLGFAAGGRWRWLALGLVGAGALALLPLFRTPRFAGLFDLQGGTTLVRLQLWRGALNMALDHPWLGVGPDNFLYAYRTTYALPSAWRELNLSHPHNIVLDFWTRLGVGGFLAGLWLFLAAFRQGWRAWRRLTGDGAALALGLLAALVATLTHGLIDNSLFLVDLMVLFGLSVGLIARLAASD